MKRRTFLQHTALSSAVTLMPNLPSLLYYHPLKKLVIIELAGGNDGWNTVVPYRNNHYYQHRPTIAIAPDKVIPLNETLGFNPALALLKPIFEAGEMCMLNNVGYPNFSDSHFKASAVWQTASPNPEQYRTGWLGRYLDHMTKQKATCGITLDHYVNKALKGDTLSSFTAHQMIDATKGMAQTVAYTPTGGECQEEQDFIMELKQVATWIEEKRNASVYYLTLGWFDTHIHQRATQDNLLKIYAKGIHYFVNLLKQSNLFDDVLIFTFSEFGRTLAENEQGGTDHGTANNVFLFNSHLKKSGFYNNIPDSNDLQKENLAYEIDFRSIYATILENWWNVDAHLILNANFDRLNFI
jgi:uncharacterized protein (DUF1501 family)